MNKKRILSFIGISCIILLSGFISLILFPQALYSKHYVSENVTSYYDEEINIETLDKALRKAQEMLKYSEIYDEEYQFDIFFAHQTPYNTLDDKLFGNWSVARAIHNNLIIKNKVDWEKGRLLNGKNYFYLEYVFAHEMVHCLQAHTLGLSKVNPLNHPPLWKMEGYAEYVSRKYERDKENYNFKKDIKKFLSLTNNNKEADNILQTSDYESTPSIYYKGKLIIQYMIEIKKLSFDEIFLMEWNENIMFDEMLNWLKDNE